MCFSRQFALCGTLLLSIGTQVLATDHFVSPFGGNNAPFLSWADAATNIQDAIDVASTGDVVWVTNGLYSTGTKVLGTGNTNRIALDKPITVQSVNGAYNTIIQGDKSASVRCAWLTNGAALRGFTLRYGGTANSGNGGGAYCYSATPAIAPIIANCLILSNTASGSGGGVYQGIVLNSAIVGNTNSSDGGVSNSRMVNCTVAGNRAGGGVAVFATNCIFYLNAVPSSLSGTFAYCCVQNGASGTGNIASNPLLLADYIHVSGDSLCRGAGTNLVIGVDIDGHAWSNPPSMGCYEWQPAPVVSTATLQITSNAAAFTVSAVAAGQPPFAYWWVHNGGLLEDDGHYSASHTPVLNASPVRGSDAGDYQLIVSNFYGMATSSVARLVIHYVDAASASPVAPYLDWASAAATIQDAIDAAAPGEVVLVTNGVYATGGRVMSGDLLNRVAIYKPVLVQSVNGLSSTIIEGVWDAATNGPSAVRCAWLTNNATLAGFTLRRGATRSYTASDYTQQYGGGVFGSSSANSTMVNCLLTNNSASLYGGGAYRAQLLNCYLHGNSAPGSGGVDTTGSGGAADQSILRNCSVFNNFAHGNGGGCSSGSLINCTVTANRCVGPQGVGGGLYSANATNCILYGNQIMASYINYTNYNSGQISYSCSSPLPLGTGNTNVNPQLLSDGIHLAFASPCRAAGNNAYVSGTDIDGQPWANPPSMGCDEWQAAPTIFTQPTIQYPSNTFGFSISLVAGGQTPLTYFWTYNGMPVEADGHFTSAHGASLTAKSLLPSDIGDYQVVVSNAVGMATSSLFHLDFTYHCVDAAATNPTPPYASWATAAATIQDAIDVAAPGDFVIVTDGVYTNGGKIMAGDLKNRVVIDKAITVESVNGPGSTIIQGSSVFPGSLSNTNVRCAWLTGGATLVGFTLQYGGTRTNGDSVTLQSGAGVWAASSAATIINCTIQQNRASADGGGVFQGTLYGCKLTSNYGSRGGGVYQSTLRACYLVMNLAVQPAGMGGGAHSSTLYNCTLVGNFATFGPGIYGGSAYNSIFISNDNSFANINYSCLYWSTSESSGGGNIFSYPQLVSDYHLAATSPCRQAGNPAYSSGFDIDGQPWATPPSMGCSEVIEANLVGPLVPHIVTGSPSAVPGKMYSMSAEVLGNVSRLAWDFGDGTVSNTVSYSSVDHVWTNLGSYTVTLTAYNNDHPLGVSTNLVVPLVPIASPTTIPVLSGIQLTFYFDSQPGVSYTLQIATNLTPPIAWRNDYTTMNSWGGPGHLADFPQVGQNRFYRVWAH